MQDVRERPYDTGGVERHAAHCKPSEQIDKNQISFFDYQPLSVKKDGEPPDAGTSERLNSK